MLHVHWIVQVIISAFLNDYVIDNKKRREKKSFRCPHSPKEGEYAIYIEEMQVKKKGKLAKLL